jgi:hypothetical protein
LSAFLAVILLAPTLFFVKPAQSQLQQNYPSDDSITNDDNKQIYPVQSLSAPSQGGQSLKAKQQSKNVFTIGYIGTEEYAANPSIRAVTSGSFQLILNNAEIDENTRNYGKVMGLGNLDIKVKENTNSGACKYKFQGSYKVYGDDASLVHDSRGWWIDLLNHAEFLQNMEPPSDKETVYAPLDKKSQQSPDCDPYFHLGRNPLLDTCNTAVINLATRMGNGTEGTATDELKCRFVISYSSFTQHEACSSGEKPISRYSRGPWSFDYQIVNGQGLVFRNVLAGDQHVFDMISIPHFRVDYNNAGTIISKNARFCDPSDPSVTTTTFVSSPSITTKDQAKGIDTISWGYTQQFNQPNSGNGLNGVLNIKYDLVIRWKGLTNCEAAGNKCFRFIPKVSFTWNELGGSKGNPSKVTAFYRLDYGENVALVKVQDGNWLVTSPFGRQPIQTQEQVFDAVTNGKAGSYDNIHSAHVGQNVKIPGCRPTQFDCIHMHLRWGDVLLTPYGRLDPRTEPSTDEDLSRIVSAGTPYVVPGQTIDIAVIKYNSAENQDPDNPTALANRESIATASRDGYQVVSAQHPILWYIASVKDTNTNTFFRHGFFVLDRAAIPSR